MILHIHSDASYNSEAKSKIREGGHFYLSNTTSIRTNMINNGAILNTSTIMSNVMASASEAKCGALFNNTKEAVSLRTTLHETGHPQPPTPVEVNNSTSVSFANKKTKQQKSKSTDKRYYWIQDRVAQKQFRVYWRPGHTNLANYFTKHFPTSYHRSTRSTYLQSANHVSSLRFCEGVLIPYRDSSMSGMIPSRDSSMSGLIHHNPCP